MFVHAQDQDLNSEVNVPKVYNKLTLDVPMTRAQLRPASTSLKY